MLTSPTWCREQAEGTTSKLRTEIISLKKDVERAANRTVSMQRAVTEANQSAASLKEALAKERTKRAAQDKAKAEQAAVVAKLKADAEASGKRAMTFAAVAVVGIAVGVAGFVM